MPYPGDIVTGAIFFGGLRAYTDAIAAAAAQRLINVRRDSDNATTDVLVATNGGLGVTINATAGPNGVSLSTWAAGAGLWVTGLYDQTAVRVLFAPANINQPQLILTGVSGLNAGLPTMSFVGTNNQVLSASGFTLGSQPYTVSRVAKITGGFSAQQTMVNLTSSTTIEVGAEFTGANTWYLCGGASFPSVSAADNVWHISQDVINGATSNIYIDGIGNVVSGGTTTFGGDISIGASFGVANPVTGNICEIGVWNTAFTTTGGGQAALMYANQNAYWLAIVTPPPAPIPIRRRVTRWMDRPIIVRR
jgi:hypothetical protein